MTTLAACGDSATVDDSLFGPRDASAVGSASDAAAATSAAMDAGTWPLPAPVVDAGLNPAPIPDASISGAPDASISGAPDASTASPDASSGGGSGPTGCTIDATTSTSSTRYRGTYAVALWIQGANNKAVKAFEAHSEPRNATLRAYPTATSGVSGLDATTGATVSGTINHHYTWDLKGPDGARVPDGSYKLAVEVHSTTQNGVVYATFTLGASPVDASGSASSDVKSLRIVCQ